MKTPQRKLKRSSNDNTISLSYTADHFELCLICYSEFIIYDLIYAVHYSSDGRKGAAMGSGANAIFQRKSQLAAQMRNFLDQTGKHWLSGARIGKVGNVFASTASQHGGQETTITCFHTTLLHQGMIIVGLPYAAKELLNMKEIIGGTPYGATTLADVDGSRQPTENELAAARFQGRHVAQIAARLSVGA